MTTENKTMILTLAKLQDFKGLTGYLDGLKDRAEQVNKLVRKALDLALFALNDEAEIGGDSEFWNEGGSGYEAIEAVKAARKEVK